MPRVPSEGAPGGALHVSTEEMSLVESGLTPMMDASRVAEPPPRFSLPATVSPPKAEQRPKANRPPTRKGCTPKTPKLEEEQDASQARAIVAARNRPSSPSSSSEPSSEDDDSSLQRMIAMRTRSHSKQTPPPTTPSRRSSRGSTQGALSTPQAVEYGWEAPQRGRNSTDSRKSVRQQRGERVSKERGAEDRIGQEEASRSAADSTDNHDTSKSTGGGAGTSANSHHKEDEEGDWGVLYCGSKDASHRVKGKHGRNTKQVVSRQYAIEARQAQREANRR